MHVVGGWWYALVSTFKTAHLQRIPAGCRLFFVVAASCGSWCASVVPLLARARCVLPPIPVSVRGRRRRGQLAGKLIFSFFLQKIRCRGLFTKSRTPIWFCWAQVRGLCHVRCAQLPEADLTSWPGRVWQSSGWSVVPLSSLPWVSSSAFSL